DGATKVFCLFLIFGLSNGAHNLFRRINQPRVASDMLVGLLLGSIYFSQKVLNAELIDILNNGIQFGMMCYMFVLGLEMNPYVMFRPPTCEAMVASAGMISTFAVACSITPFLSYVEKPNPKNIIFFCISLSGCGSHVLTRIISSFKIGKSDIGKLGISAGVHSDMISIFLFCICYAVFPPGPFKDTNERIQKSIKMGSALVIQTIFAAKVSPIFMNWVNSENPEGKTLKGSHLVLSLALMVMICSCSPVYGYDSTLSSFMAGLFLPSEGRISKWAISKFNYTLSTIFYPVFFFWMGFHASLSDYDYYHPMTYVRLFLLFVMVIAMKVLGTVLCGVLLGFHWPESVALGLLLTAKGHHHVYATINAANGNIITFTTCDSILFLIFLTFVHKPYVVASIVRRARKRAPTHRMALQWLDPSNELRILQCLHGPWHIPSTINFMEISRGTGDSGTMVYVTDMVELTNEIAATIVRHGGEDTVTVTDKSVTNMRDQITAAVNAYVDENGDGITIKRMLALSTFHGMAQDICLLAEDLMVPLVVLPFHRYQNPDGTLDGGHPGFRYVNRKVLRTVQCSVGILVDRGFGKIGKITRSFVSINVAIIFIGGKDDREALAYCRQVARHTGVKLTVIRFLVNNDSDNLTRNKASNYRYSVAEQEEEMKLDDECFAEFYERHVGRG
ncbi:Na_H_Exchanger domain-containing protein, partial [Cephalotus follicularis]